VVDLEIIQQEVGVLADGPTDTTLHSASYIKADEPQTRVIYRVQYTPIA
jgi:hypothetical protein